MTARHVLVANAMQALHRTLIPGTLRLAPDVGGELTVLDTPNCPYVLTWVGPGEVYSKGGGWKVEAATARVFVFVETLGQNDVPSRTLEGLGALGAITDLYVTIGNVRLLTPSDTAAEGYQATINTGPDATHVTHGGLRADLQFGGRAFVGFEVQVPILISWGGT